MDIPSVIDNILVELQEMKTLSSEKLHTIQGYDFQKETLEEKARRRNIALGEVYAYAAAITMIKDSLRINNP